MKNYNNYTKEELIEEIKRLKGEDENINLNPECLKKVKMLFGIPPYNKWNNVCYGDGFFYMSIIKDFGQEEYKACEEYLQKKYNIRGL